jgi:hypothetical protein
MCSFAVRSVCVWSLAGLLCGFSDRPRPSDAEVLAMFYTETLPAAATSPSPKPATRNRVNEAPPRMTRRVGFRYSLLVSEPWGVREADASDVFKAGDMVRVRVEPNIPGYLYVVQKGSGGQASTLFPHPQLNMGHNRVESGGTYTVPAPRWFVFDERPGEEKLTIIVSREPLKSLPRFAHAGEHASIDLAVIARELDVLARPGDVYVAKETSGERSSPATVVVNAANTSNHLVYADIILKHR